MPREKSEPLSSVMAGDPNEMIDRYLDGALSPEETAVFDEVLRSDGDLRGEFRSRVRVHGLITRHFAWEDAQDSLPPLASFPEKASGSKRWPWIAATAVTAAAAILLFAFLLPDRSGKEASFGSFTATDESLELRRYDFTDEQLIEIHLDTGIEIVIEAPASFQFRDAFRLELFDGKLVADVPEGAEGFTVVTPRGEIIDLGTRFGVSVSEDKVETHVFEGEVEVRQKGQSKPVRLQESESMNLAKKTTGGSDSVRFPMPAHILTASLDDSGFEESSEIDKGKPVTFRTWGGDEHRKIEGYPVSSTGGGGTLIQPAEGSRMLQFLGTSATPEEPRGQASELWQMIDLTPYADEVNRGGVEATFSTKFNRVPGTSQIDHRFGIALVAFQGSEKLASSYWDRKNEPLSEQLAATSTALKSDDDPATWEFLSCEFVVPPGTDFLIAQIYAFEDQSDDEENEFEGHFADSCKLQLIARARPSEQVATWAADDGSWHKAGNWEGGELPDEARDIVRVVDAKELRIEKSVRLKQSLWLAYHRGHARLRIAPGGELERSGIGELVLGLNVGGVAELVVEGRLLTSGKVLIGRNNSESRLIVDGGEWISRSGLIRMSQYGNQGPDTVSDLIVKNGGTVSAEAIELVHDLATLTIESGGLVEVSRLQIGGEDGEARVVVRDGVLRVRELKFGQVKSVLELAGSDAVIELLGEWNEDELREMPGADWVSGSGFKTESFTREGEMWTRVSQVR